jgi:hypothetical protein
MTEAEEFLKVLSSRMDAEKKNREAWVCKRDEIDKEIRASDERLGVLSDLLEELRRCDRAAQQKADQRRTADDPVAPSSEPQRKAEQSRDGSPHVLPEVIELLKSQKALKGRVFLVAGHHQGLTGKGVWALLSAGYEKERSEKRPENSVTGRLSELAKEGLIESRESRYFLTEKGAKEFEKFSQYIGTGGA